MNFYEKLKKVCDEKGVSMYAVENATGMSKGSSAKWKTSSPKAETIEKIADYFNVSVDYLLGRTDVPGFSPSEFESISPTAVREVTPEEDDLLEYFRELGIKKGAKAQAAALEMIKKLTEI